LTDSTHKSGFAAIIGRPNAGKSTLLNQILGTKVAIISDKPQTTRNSIRGIYTTPAMQTIFIDTPGIHKPKHLLDKQMMAAVNDSLAGSDIVLYLVDSTAPFGRGEEFIIKQLAGIKKPVFLVLNKIDLITPEQLLPLIAFYNEKYPFTEIVPLSAASGENTDRLLKVIENYLQEGPELYPADMISDEPEQQFMAELIREQALAATYEEIPHSLAVLVTVLEERVNGTLYVEANIYVERESQKGIIIGKGGAMLKTIGSGARREMEKIFACPIYLELRVKTRKDWRNNSGILRNLKNSDQ
jgi:GTP-binding protein Era